MGCRFPFPAPFIQTIGEHGLDLGEFGEGLADGFWYPAGEQYLFDPDGEGSAQRALLGQVQPGPQGLQYGQYIIRLPCPFQAEDGGGEVAALR